MTYTTPTAVNYSTPTTPWTRPATGGLLLGISLLATFGSFLFAMGLLLELFELDGIFSGAAGRITAAVVYLIWVSIEHLAWAFGIHFFTQKLSGMKPHNALRWTARISAYLNAGTMLLIAFCFLVAAIAADSSSDIAGFCIVVALIATFALLVFRAAAAITLGLWMIRFADALKRNVYRIQTWIITIWYGVVLTMLAAFPLLGIIAGMLSTRFPTLFDGPVVLIVFFCLIGIPLPYAAVFLFFLARQSPNIATYEGAFPMMSQVINPSPVLSSQTPSAPPDSPA